MISKARIKQIRTLHLKKNRDAEQLFLAEGIKTVTELLEHSAGTINEVFATIDFINGHRQLLKKAGIVPTEISEQELLQISTQKSPNSVLAICNYFTNHPKQGFSRKFTLYLDDIRDPGNMGTILRLADWFGILTVYCSETSCDIYNPKVIQSTMGAFARVAVTYCSLEKLVKESGIKNIYGAVLNGHNVYSENLQEGIIVIGNEANGISEQNLKLVNKPITIPSHSGSGAESLNAAMAAAILVAEFSRQIP